jgi:hypothetical protein
MAEEIRIAHLTDHQNPIRNLTTLPSPIFYFDPAAANEYNAATISGIVFGIFMALVTIYTIWRNSRQLRGKELVSNLQESKQNTDKQNLVLIRYFMQEARREPTTMEGVDIEIEAFDSTNPDEPA